MNHEDYIAWYKEDRELQNALDDIATQTPTDCILQGELLYKGDRLCVPSADEHVRWIHEAHLSKIAGHFGVTKTIQNL